MDIAATGAIERIARVLAGQHLSRNADGDEAHAAARVDATWQEYRDDAVAILKTLREPDADMERAGDIAVWQRMIAAALGDGGEASGSSEGRSAAPPDPRAVT
ncbi:MAG: hypothetical protein JWM65_3245 [Sphingomonas bacterium]|nr:hypothetical protein [Sphingomonas bacterium]